MRRHASYDRLAAEPHDHRVFPRIWDRFPRRAAGQPRRRRLPRRPARRRALRQPGRGRAARLRRRARAAGPPEPRDDPFAPPRRHAVPRGRVPAADARARPARPCASTSTGSSAATAAFCRSATPRRRWRRRTGAAPSSSSATSPSACTPTRSPASRARIVAATDAERRRIGRDLHDGAQQRLVRALMGIEEARRAPARADDGARSAPPPTPATRSTTCASWPPASTRWCSPTAASARRSRS